MNSIAIVFAFDTGYVEPTIVCFKSMLVNKRATSMYDVYFLHQSIAETEIQKFHAVASDYKNIKLNFIDMKDRYAEFSLENHWTTPAFYRYAIPELLPTYNKAIYLDGDIIVSGDLTDYFNEDIEGFYLGAVKSALNYNIATGFNKRLGRDYIGFGFNSGSLLMNLAEFRKNNLTEKLIHVTKTKKLLDQYALNIVCKGHVKFLPLKYNGFVLDDVNIIKYVFPLYFEVNDIEETYNSPYILHYLTSKPWLKSRKKCSSHIKSLIQLWDKYQDLTVYKRASVPRLHRIFKR